MAARSAVRNKRAPASTPEIDWKITSSVEPSEVDGHPLRMMHFRFQRRGHRPLKFTVPAEDGMDMYQEIGRAYDAVN